MTAPANETAYFWRLASNLQAALRCCACGPCVDHCYDDLEGLAFTTDNYAIRARCEALLEQRPVREITREPFYADIDHFRPKADFHGTGFLLDNFVITCAHLA